MTTDTKNQARRITKECIPKKDFLLCPLDAESIKSKRERMLARRSQILVEINHGA